MWKKMTEEQFSLQVQRLQANYNKNAFNEQRLSLIRSYARELDYNEFEQIVTGFIKVMRLAPMPSDFEKACRTSRLRLENRHGGSPGDSQRVINECESCYESGLLIIKKRDGSDNKLKFVKCDCVFGEEETYKLPVFNSELFPDWQIVENSTFWNPFHGSDNRKGAYSRITAKVEQFKKAIIRSEEFWQIP